MIEELAVSNLGVIDNARLEPAPGLTVLTGETGAGKTMLLGALRLLLGAAASEDAIGPAATEARVEGRFRSSDGEGEFVAARRLVTGGRSRAYLDGAMVPAKVLEERAGSSVELVGQHDRLRLTRSREIRAMLDRALDPAGAAARGAYTAAWAKLEGLRSAQLRLGGDERALQRELDLVRHQAAEIAAPGFAPGEDEELRSRAMRLRNVEGLGDGLSRAAAALDGDEGAGAALGIAVSELRRLVRLDESLTPLAAQAGDAAELVTGIEREVRHALLDLERDPGALDEVEQRLALLGGLQRKYGATLGEVLAFGRAAARRVDELEAQLEMAGGLGGEIEAATAAVAAAGGELRAARAAAGKRLADDAVGHLGDLGFRDASVAFVVEPADAGPSGADRVELRFSSDRRLPPGPVRKVASGGELSRLVLALRLAGGAGEAPVLVFDEIDAGVGGATALAVGRKLAALAATSQVLCVTHLPQVAAFADTHVVVTRDGGAAAVVPVDGEARLEELTRMLSGLPESTQGRGHARELLTMSGKD